MSKAVTRREMILGGGSLAALAGVAVYTRALRDKPSVYVTGPDVPAFDAAKDLSGLTHPLRECGAIGGVSLSRLILGGNMIAGWAHGRDMRFYNKLIKAYFTDARVFRNFRIAEACGINAILTSPSLMRVINRYWREEGGRIKFISNCGHRDGLLAGARESVENGASLLYYHGEHAETAADKGDWKSFREFLDGARALGVPVGIGCHRLSTVKFCVAHDCLPDFWMKTVHRTDYPTAHLGEDKKPSKNGLGVCDNRFVDTDRQEVFDYMENRPEPWIAFKVLGAGIEHPRDAFPVVYRGGADFACVGMYDYQVVEDVNIANEVFRDGLPERKRPWRG